MRYWHWYYYYYYYYCCWCWDVGTCGADFKFRHASLLGRDAVLKEAWLSRFNEPLQGRNRFNAQMNRLSPLRLLNNPFSFFFFSHAKAKRNPWAHARWTPVNPPRPDETGRRSIVRSNPTPGQQRWRQGEHIPGLFVTALFLIYQTANDSDLDPLHD